ncbi:MucR family transcriptional regulator [Methylobacterium sp. NEAU 140]|uniref:MucR family transcriptional regulator n=1 Tax=Methylobacterium sp. NEAU 140 TaxID=3064945 RepID=UPI00273426B5|nr:MucR family transcriptional regulator [Methylobacterium sp. NEAU 140]MDP4023585.1 MucR family transcriptional regulator [Methylobacterium sp. NEAU 140]
MTEENAGLSPDFIALTSEIVAAYVSNNHVAPADLPALITQIHAAIGGLASGRPAVVAEAPVEKPSTAQIRRSIQPEGIVSFIDGRTYKTLKRHLTANGLTPEGYRTRYGLPVDYPLVSPSYSEQRSNLARAIGLGVPGARADVVGQEPKGARKAA